MSSGSKLTHVDASGKAQMVDVGEKAATERVAVAEGTISMRPETLAPAQFGALAQLLPSG